MAIPVTINGVEYPSRMAYFRTLEDQGNRSDASFYMHMRLKHDREFYEKEIKRTCAYLKKRYHNDTEFKKRVNNRRTKYYFDHKNNVSS